MSDQSVDVVMVGAVTYAIERICTARGVPAPPRTPHNDVDSLSDYWTAAVAAVGDDLGLAVAADLPIGSLGMITSGVLSPPTPGDSPATLASVYLRRALPMVQLRILPAAAGRVSIELRSEGPSPLADLLEEMTLAVFVRHFALLAMPP